MKLTHQEIINLLIILSILLISGRILGEIFRKLKQPMVVGELLAGILLGPTVLGTFWPSMHHIIFPVNHSMLALDAFSKVAVTLLLFIAGLEVELNIVLKHGKQALNVSMFSIVIPFAIGFISPIIFPDFFNIPTDRQLLFSLFLGTALSITAMPVLARILMDLNLLKTELGMVIIASAMVDDFMGWMFFSVLLSMINNNIDIIKLLSTVAFTFIFAVFMLTIGKFLLNKVLPFVNKNLAWPGGILSLSIAFCFIAASTTEYFGIHSIFGAFIFGVALGDSIHFTEKAKEILYQFVNNIFAPLFFVAVGLKVNFAINFDLSLTLIILLIAFAGKMLGGFIGAKLGGYSSKSALSIASCMNARGAMEIILGLLALEAGIINEKIFVSLVIMALVTSISAGPMAKWFLRKDTSYNVNR